MAMNPEEAWLYAASWGSYMTSGDPGACMYGFDERFTVQSESHRREVKDWIQRKCRPNVIACPHDFDADELDKMDSFLVALANAPCEESKP